jgi:hypothetical protein
MMVDERAQAIDHQTPDSGCYGEKRTHPMHGPAEVAPGTPTRTIIRRTEPHVKLH